ncbi:MAG: ABC transporter substrate-binding protein [Candidatus Kariarchaeaceae archaeon]|jgi:ABC-type branched-subunit amino acid transport system substrate-binding protein
MKRKTIFYFLAMLMVFGFAFSTYATGNRLTAIETHAAPAEIKLGGLFPLTGTLSGGGVEREAAFRMAIEEINEDTTLLPDSELTYLVKDTNTDPATGVSVAGELISWGADGLVGAASSSVSMAVASGPAKTSKVPQISYSSTNALLSDKATYPYFLRVAPPDSIQGVALANIVDEMGWKHVSTLATSDDYGQGGIEVFEDAATALGITIEESQKFAREETDVKSQLQVIKDGDAKVIVLNVIVGDAKTVFAQAADIGLTAEEGYIWVGTDGPTQSQVFEGDAALEAAMQGMIGTRPNTGFGTVYDDFVTMWSDCKGSDSTEYEGCGPDDLPNTYATFAYDAVYAFAHAFEAMIADDAAYPFDGDLLLAELYKTDFTGATGPVSFNVDGDREGVYDIVNLQDDVFKVVGSWDKVAKMTLTDTIYWDGDSSNGGLLVVGTETGVPVVIKEDEAPGFGIFIALVATVSTVIIIRRKRK